MAASWVFWPMKSSAHGGDLDDCGGHYVYSGETIVGYHFHQDLRTNNPDILRELRVASRDAQKKNDYETAAMVRYLMNDYDGSMRYFTWAKRQGPKSRKLIVEYKERAVKDVFKKAAAQHEANNRAVEDQNRRIQEMEEHLKRREENQEQQRINGSKAAIVYLYKKVHEGYLCQVKWPKGSQRNSEGKLEYGDVAPGYIYLRSQSGKGYTQGKVIEMEIYEDGVFEVQLKGKMTPVKAFKQN